MVALCVTSSRVASAEGTARQERRPPVARLSDAGFLVGIPKLRIGGPRAAFEASWLHCRDLVGSTRCQLTMPYGWLDRYGDAEVTFRSGRLTSIQIGIKPGHTDAIVEELSRHYGPSQAQPGEAYRREDARIALVVAELTVSYTLKSAQPRDAREEAFIQGHSDDCPRGICSGR